MAKALYRHLKGRIEQNVLVLMITETKVQDEKLADALLQELLDAVAHYAVNKVVVDMQKIKYLSSVAFRPLLGVRSKLRETGGQMILCGLTPVVGDIFYTTKMLGSSGSYEAPFLMEPDVAAAVKRLNRDAADK